MSLRKRQLAWHWTLGIGLHQGDAPSMSPFQPSLGSPSPGQSPSCMPWAAGEAALCLRLWAVQPQQDSEGKATAAHLSGTQGPGPLLC